MQKKRYPLPKRFNAALSEKAYRKLRVLNEKYSYGNNYILTLILENAEEIMDAKALEDVFENFEKEYGSPQNK